MALTQLAQIALNTTDVLMIGRLGPQALASASLGNAFWITLFLFSLGVVVAVSPLAAQAHGARKPRTMRRIARQGLWVAVVVGLPICVVMAFGEPILVLLGQEPANAHGAGIYLNALVWGTMPAIAFIALRGYVTAFGIVKPMMIIAFAAIPLNAVLDYILIFGKFGAPRLELFGAGITTSTVNILTFVALVLYTARSKRFRRKAVFARIWRSEWSIFREIFRVGAPIGVLLLMEVGLFMAAAIMMGWIGTSELAAHQIALQVASVSFMVPLGMSQAVTIRIGHAAGRMDLEAIKRAAWASLIIGVGFGVVMAVAMVLFGAPIVGWFLDQDRADTALVATLGVSYLMIAALFQITDGIQCIGAGVLRGLKDTRWPMIFGFVGYWVVGAGSSYLFGFHLGMDGVGVWLGLFTGLSAAAVMALWRFNRLCRTYGS